MTTSSVVRGCEVFNVGMTAGTPGDSVQSGGIALYQVCSSSTIAGNKVHDCMGNGIHVGASTLDKCCVQLRRRQQLRLELPRVQHLRRRHLDPEDAGNRALEQLRPDGVRGERRHRHQRDRQHSGRGSVEQRGPAPRNRCLLRHREFGHDRADGSQLQPLRARSHRVPRQGRDDDVRHAGGLAGGRGSEPRGQGIEHDRRVDGLHLRVRPPHHAPVRRVQQRQHGRSRDRRHRQPTEGRSAVARRRRGLGKRDLRLLLRDAAVRTRPAERHVHGPDVQQRSSGVQTWAWDFENDGIDDAFTSNPSFNYVVPGTYSVKLTVMDLTNGSSNFVRTNYITVGPYVFDAQTNVGTGDLTIYGIPGAGCRPRRRDTCSSRSRPRPSSARVGSSA